MQQKEWEFRFKDNDIPLFGITNLVVIYAFIAIYMCMIITASTLPDKFAFYSSLTFFKWVASLTTICIYIWIAEILYGIISFALKKRKENLWLKEATKGLIFPEPKPTLKRIQEER